MVNLIFLMLSFLLAGRGFSEQMLTMKVGEKISVKLSSYEPIKVSRKGIVELIQMNDEQWHIVALKKGSVVITSSNFDGSQEKIIIFVENHRELKNKTERVWSDFICDAPGISCENFEIKGTSQSWRWFYQVKKRCMTEKPCIFKVVLTSDSKLGLKKYLYENYGMAVDTGDDHMILIRQACESTSLENIIPQFLEPFLLKQCNAQNLSMKVKVFWLKSDTLKKFGLNFRENWAGNLITDLGANLESFLQENQQHVIAQSESLAILGEQVLFRIGRNSLYSVNEERSDLLKSGLSITIKPIELRRDKIKLGINMDLSQSQGGVNRFDANEYQSHLWLDLDKDLLVSSLSMNITDITENGIPILKDIPIIAPLFNGNSRGVSHAQIFISMKLSLI